MSTHKENKKNACVIEQKILVSLFYAICTSIVPSNKFILYKIQNRCLVDNIFGTSKTVIAVSETLGGVPKLSVGRVNI